MARGEFLATMAVTGAGLGNALTASVAGKRVFLASVSHETNTFHPVPTTSLSYEKRTHTRRRKPAFPFEPETPFDADAAPAV